MSLSMSPEPERQQPMLQAAAQPLIPAHSQQSTNGGSVPPSVSRRISPKWLLALAALAMGIGYIVINNGGDTDATEICTQYDRETCYGGWKQIDGEKVNRIVQKVAGQVPAYPTQLWYKYSQTRVANAPPRPTSTPKVCVDHVVPVKVHHDMVGRVSSVMANKEYANDIGQCGPFMQNAYGCQGAAVFVTPVGTGTAQHVLEHIYDRFPTLAPISCSYNSQKQDSIPYPITVNGRIEPGWLPNKASAPNVENCGYVANYLVSSSKWDIWPDAPNTSVMTWLTTELGRQCDVGDPSMGDIVASTKQAIGSLRVLAASQVGKVQHGDGYISQQRHIQNLDAISVQLNQRFGY
jgi:hypothetical protein